MEREAQTKEEGIYTVLFASYKSCHQKLDSSVTTPVPYSVLCMCCPLQALEEEFTRKLQEQEVFFKMSGESECLNPTTQSRVSKFYPIPNLHNSGL